MASPAKRSIKPLEEPSKRFKPNPIESFSCSFPKRDIAKLKTCGSISSRIFQAFGEGCFVHICHFKHIGVCVALSSSYSYRVTFRCRNWISQQADGLHDYSMLGAYEELVANFTDDDGSLRLVLDIEKKEIDSGSCVYKSRPTSLEGRQLFESREVTADSTFVVEGETFPLHKCVLHCQCPMLYELAERSKGERVVIENEGLTKEGFAAVIEAIYDRTAKPYIESEDRAKAFIRSAAYLDLSHHKMKAENYVVEKFLNIHNAPEFLILADSLQCARLKEDAMKVCLSYYDDVQNSPGWKGLRRSPALLTELLAFGHATSSSVADCMDVSTPRKESLKKKLDVHGTFDMLVNPLQEVDPSTGKDGT